MDRKSLEKDFFDFYETETDALFRFIFFRVNDRELAKDLVQDCFSKMWEELIAEKSIEYKRALLYRIATNKIIDWYRKHKEHSLDEMMESGFDSTQEVSLSIEETLDSQWAVEMLRELPEHYRAVLWLRFVEDWTVKDIAQSLKESENVVSVRIHRALARWRSLLRGGRKNPSSQTSQKKII